MQRETSILLIALVLIVAIGFIGASYGRITGQAVQGTSSYVRVAPSVARPRETIHVFARAGCNAGMVASSFGLHNPQGDRVAQFIMPGSIIRYQEVGTTMYIPSNLAPGRYSVIGHDRCTESNRRAFLDIV